MQLEKKRLPGRVKLVGALLLAACMGTITAFVQFVAKSAATAVLSAATDTTILVHLDSAKNYSEANEFCAEEYNTHLATIEDSTANQRLSAMLQWYQVEAWIGFADLQNADDFDWVDANPNAYTNWDAGEPTDLCVQMLAATGTWKDVDCSEELTTFFCEAPADASATALVRVDNAAVHSLPFAKSSAEAQTYCQAQGGELYSVQDSADNARIQTALNALSVDFAFFGLQTAASSYQWADGRPLDFDSWATGQPLESQFSLMRATDGKWLTACSSEAALGVVCTIPFNGMCDDGCEIDSDYFNDAYCDCSQCEDEPNWSCESCGGCGVICGAYVECESDEFIYPNEYLLAPDTCIGDLYMRSIVSVSFSLKVHSSTVRSQVIHSEIESHSGDFPKLELDTNLDLLANWGTADDGELSICEGQTLGKAVLNEWVHIELRATATVQVEESFCELYLDNELQCRRNGSWFGQNMTHSVYMTDAGSIAADAWVSDFFMDTN